jgi:signal transduction histidine kinase
VQLVRLVNTLLDASRVLGGRLRLDRHLTDLRTVLAAAADNVRADLSAKGQHLTWNLPERPVWCVVDTERLQEVVLNLLTNAHRYTPEGGTIEVSAEQQGEAAVMFTVRDTGVGLAPETRDRVFRPFERHSHSPQGLGLGLTISLGIVRAHGGNISVDSNEPDPGSTFRVELPGVLGRTREICAAVQRTRSQTRVLVERSRALRAGLEPATGTSRRGRE